jgi:hypothetical protein
VRIYDETGATGLAVIKTFDIHSSTAVIEGKCNLKQLLLPTHQVKEKKT